jgi:16S rRNA (guanine527-N7)-methyltransferase
MDELEQYARSILGIQLSPAQIETLQWYENELIDWNSQHNLTAIIDPEQIRVKHFLDSLTCLLVMDDTPVQDIVDVGTGAGFPGIPLKIINPETRLTLIESVGKKARFCQHVVNSLCLEDVEVIHDRVESIGRKPEYRQRYQWAVARAVAVLPTLVEYLLPLLRINGKMIAMKGEDAPAEAHDADYATSIMGGHLRKLHHVTLPGVAEERYLVLIDKIASTPDVYPRRIGIPRKRPLKPS